jgi:transposase
LTYAERKKKISRDKRYARYEEVLALHRAGIGLRAIARQLRISRKVVRRFVASPCFPERAEGTGQHHKKSKLAPYLPYLRERWAAGAHNGLHLIRSIKERGYTGSRALLGRLIAEWRTELPPKPRQGKPRKPHLVAKSGQRRLSSRSASFLMILPFEKLTVVQRQQLEHICQASSDLHTVYLFSQEFVTMLKERQAESLQEWLKRAKESHVAELKSFANGILRDYAAVYAACSRLESNGGTSGHVNRLKLSLAPNVWPCASGPVTREGAPRGVVVDGLYAERATSCSVTSHRRAPTV